jgi:hypothetical protein
MSFKIPFFIISAFFISTIQILAQGNIIARRPIVLNWKNTPDTLSNEGLGRLYFMSFEGAAYDESEMMPLKTEKFSIARYANVRVELSNPVFEQISSSLNWGQEKIKDEIIFNSFVSTEKGRPTAQISFIPIRKNNNGIFERLVSADLLIYAADTEYNTAAFAKSFSTFSKLNDGQIFKIKVGNSGVYKIDYQFLSSLGVDVNNIDPRNIQILGNGGKMLSETVGSSSRVDDLVENAIFVQGESDAQFNNSDYILFYAQGKDYWNYNSLTGFYNRTENIYSDEICYFIKIASAPGKRINDRASLPSGTYSSTVYDALEHYEVNSLNLMEKEFALPPSGRLWLGNPFQISRNQSFSFNFNNRISTEPIKIQTVIYSRTFSSGSFDAKLNGASLFSAAVQIVNNYIYSTYARKIDNLSSVISSGNNLNLELQYNNSSSTAEAWLDYIIVNARCQLSFNGGQMSFRDAQTIGKGSVNYQISNAGSSTIWDITNPYDVLNQNYSGSGNISFNTLADTLRNFVIFDGSNFLTPTAVGAVANQNLHGITSAPNLLIVYHRDFQAAATRLASHRASHSGISTMAVDIEQVYNEFSSGHADVTAIRDFSKMLYDRSSGNDSLRYLLLFGRGSFDYKGNNSARSRNNNFILAYETEQSTDPLKTYTTDDYFALMDDGEGNLDQSSLMDIAVGRLPVSTAAEAEDLVTKIINYDTQIEGFGDWRSRLTFFADDEDGNLHLDDTENIAQLVTGRDTVYNIDKIYSDAYPQVSTAGGSRYPDVNDALLRNIFKGNLLMCYLGHGGPDGLAQERIFTTSEINTLDNENKLPLFITATCSFAPFDDPETVSAADLLLLNPRGGAIALLTTVRVVLADANEHLTRNTFNHIFNPIENRFPRLGEVLLLAKNNSGLQSASNSRKFVLLGDPSQTLAYPKERVVTTKINGNTVSGNDTIAALQFVTIQGEIQDKNGNLLNNFNGTVYPTVFDKHDTIQTRGNDAGSYVKRFPLQKKIIFKGRATVTNGQFSFSFYVPKDINYNMGKGKIYYYAENALNTDAHGTYRDLYIGGTSNNSISDNIGPDVKVFMNNENFASGGMTDENPLLYVRLNDDSGINTVGNGIGHDLTGVLTYIQDEEDNIYNLNDFYEADLNDFRSGKINYPLQKLPVGKHLVKVKAWDVFNNMGEGSTEFIVASDDKMALAQVLNYPNPFTTHTEFMFEHNLPGQELEVLIQIYSVSGKLVKTISSDLSSAENDGYRVRGIDWDGLDEYGDRLGRGVYVYKVTVRATGPAAAGSESPKIQKNSEYQKLVILK